MKNESMLVRLAIGLAAPILIASSCALAQDNEALEAEQRRQEDLARQESRDQDARLREQEAQQARERELLERQRQLDELRAAEAQAQGQRAAQQAELQALVEVTRRGVAQQEAEVAAARRKLEASRQQLEAAAREVAQLSASPGYPNFFGYRQPTNWPPAVIGALVDNTDEGARVVSVTPGGPAAAAGIKAGDLVVSIDGIELVNPRIAPLEIVVDHLAEVGPGAVVAFVVDRDGETRTVEIETRANDVRQPFVRLDPRGTNIFTPRGHVQIFSPFASPWSQMELVTLNEALGRYFGTSEGLLVVRAPDDEAIGLEDGDVILAIGGRTPTSPEHAMRILSSFEAGETLELSIMRQQRRRSVEYEIPASPRTAGRSLD